MLLLLLLNRENIYKKAPLSIDGYYDMESINLWKVHIISLGIYGDYDNDSMIYWNPCFISIGNYFYYE